VSKMKWAQFTSNLPDDQVEENGSVVRFGGLNVCTVLADIVCGMGFEVEGPYEAHLSGWEIYAKKRKLSLVVFITDLADGIFLLGASEVRIFFNSDRRRKWFAEEVLVPFNKGLRNSDFFTQVGWISPDDAPIHKDPSEEIGVYSPADPAAPEK
jgi:hypothetical protein